MISFYYDSILCTGGSGLVGQYLQQRLKPQFLPNIHYISSKDYDLCNMDDVKKMMDKYKPKVVIHLAARVGGIVENIKYPVDFYEQNILMNTNVLQQCHEHNVEKVIGIISTCAYPDVVEKYPMVEDDLFNGRPPETNFSYAFAKRAMAAQIDAYVKQYNKKWCYLIPCNLYGEFDKFDPERSHFVSALLQKIMDADDKIQLFGTGKPLRQFMYADDLAKLIVLMLNADIVQNFNVATDEIYSIKEIAEIALNALDEDLKIEFDETKPNGQYRKDVSCKKLLSHFPHFGFTPLSAGIEKVYNAMMIQKNNGQ